MSFLRSARRQAPARAPRACSAVGRDRLGPGSLVVAHCSLPGRRDHRAPVPVPLWYPGTTSTPPRTRPSPSRDRRCASVLAPPERRPSRRSRGTKEGTRSTRSLLWEGTFRPGSGCPTAARPPRHGSRSRCIRSHLKDVVGASPPGVHPVLLRRAKRLAQTLAHHSGRPQGSRGAADPWCRSRSEQGESPAAEASRISLLRHTGPNGR